MRLHRTYSPHGRVARVPLPYPPTAVPLPAAAHVRWG